LEASLGPARIVIHADVDAFYAAVEQRDDPTLRGLPVAVGGLPQSRGVVMTASYEARAFGVRSAMPSRQAVELCPQLVIVPPRFDAYQDASRRIMDIFARFATVVEPVSMDEAFLDLTGRVRHLGAATDTARTIKRLVTDATALTVSLGVSGNKLVAKIASDHQKPNGLTVVPTNEARAFLAPLPIRSIWGIGPKTEAALARHGIETAGQLADLDDGWLLSRLGQGGLRLRAMARGEDDRPVAVRGASKQISREITYERDTRDRNQLVDTIAGMAKRIEHSLLEAGPARTVHIKLRYGDFSTITRQQRALHACHQAGEIQDIATALLDRCWDGRPVRLIGVGVSNFSVQVEGQLPLLPPAD